MNLSKVGKDIENLDPKQRQSILSLIKTQPQYDMEKVVSELSKLRHEWTTSHNALKNEVTVSHNALKNGYSVLESKIDSKLTTVYWVVGTAGATIATLLTALGLIALIK